MNVDSVTIYRSTDGGRRWHLESRSPMLRAPGTAGGLPAACDKFVSFSTPSEGWAAGACAVGMPPLCESTDAGRTWVRRQVGPFQRPTNSRLGSQRCGSRRPLSWGHPAPLAWVWKVAWAAAWYIAAPVGAPLGRPSCLRAHHGRGLLTS